MLTKQTYLSMAVLAAAVFLPTAAQAAQSNGAPAEDVVNLTTQAGGIHQISFADLANDGIDLDGTPIVDIGLLNQGNLVPVQVTGSSADPALFGAGSTVRFIAQELNTLYSDTNVYTLRLDQSAQTLMTPQTLAIRSGAPAPAYLASAKYAPQNKYSFVSPDQNDPWYASRVVAVGSAQQETITLNLDHVAQVGDQSGAKLNVNVWGSTDLAGAGKDHHVSVQMNGQTVMSSKFDGLQSRQLQADIGVVQEGGNEVTVTLPMDTGFAFDAVNVNEIEVRYPRQFMAQANRLDFESSETKFSLKGFSGAALPNGADDLIVFKEDLNGVVHEIKGSSVLCRPSSCRIEVAGDGQLGHYYVAAKTAVAQAGLASLPLAQDIQSGGAAYLIISHPDFIGASGNNQLEALAVQMAGEYGSADVVDVQSIYAQYGNHIFDPKAIQAYIKDAAKSVTAGGRGTEVVLLVGGDVYDYRGFENDGAQSFIPSIYAATGNNITFAPVDAKYADIDDDNVPDLAIARLPVRTTAQLSSLLSKRADYQARDYSGKVLLVADEYDDLQQYDFAGDADEIETDFLEGLSVSKAYVDTFKENGQGVAQARTAVIDGINEGQTMTAFFGHSSTNQWSFNGLFNGPDAANLENEGRPTVVAQWGCWNTYYVSPNEDSMGHRLMMEGNQGAVAVMGATTLTDANAERELARLVFERLGNGERLGEAVTNAKQVYAQTNPDDLDVLLGWTILGLPELTIN